MKKLILIMAGGLISAIMYGQVPGQDSLNRQRQADPTILNPAPVTPRTYPAVPSQKVDTPVYRLKKSDAPIYRTEPRDDRDPSKTPQMDRDTIKK